MTGEQVREACELLWWDRSELQRRTSLPLASVDRTLASPGEVDANAAEGATIRNAFVRAGLEFTSKGGVRLRQDSRSSDRADA